MDDQRIDRAGGGYSLKRLLVSVSMISGGLAMFGPMGRWVGGAMAKAQSDMLFLPLLALALAMAFGGPVLIGVGLLWPFKKPWLGVVLGIVMFVCVVLFKLATEPPE